MLRDYVKKIMSGRELSVVEAGAAMEKIMSGEVSAVQLAAFLTALKLKGETSKEIAGFAKSLLQQADRVQHDMPVLCNCGTGGDAKGTFNVSTTAAFVLAAGGVYVAKHGNRGVSSSSGSADVLTALGVNVDLPAGAVQEEIKRLGIGFLFAPALNKAMRHVAQTRRELGFRTVFNLLGPIINPARLDYQLVGVYDGAMTYTVAEVLGEIGVRHALVVHSSEGLDEISTHEKTLVSELQGGKIIEYEINPADYGFESGSLADYRGGTPAENAQILRGVLSGEHGPQRDIVLLNAAAGFYVAEKAASIKDGLSMAAAVVDSGRALQKLEDLISLSNETVAV